ncbi:hypothetical protein GWI33_016310 [Rhynchophorus ferrugineus]|uniref:Uncharacterized protein n=1 Tax=Rhynchophorus ferrugineus TaxID=354439 RepID=A0A834I1G8_RHYFE|nr:hypothetical protein GWI33_016310 [Rhynchophorus ferrugineus]
MSTTPPLPFESLPNNGSDYSQWCDMINSIVGFVTASTNMASVLKNSNYYIPDLLTIVDSTKKPKDQQPVFNLNDFPWFTQLVSATVEPQLSFHEMYKVSPLIEYQCVDNSMHEPSRTPRLVTLTNVDGFGDSSTYRSPTTPDEINYVNSNTPILTKLIKPETSSDSCFFNEYSDSEQTIESTNLQEVYEEQDESKEELPQSSTSPDLVLQDRGEQKATKKPERIKRKCQKLTCSLPTNEFKNITKVTKVVCVKPLVQSDDKLSQQKLSSKSLPGFKNNSPQKGLEKKKGRAEYQFSEKDFILKNIVNTLNIAKRVNKSKIPTRSPIIKPSQEHKPKKMFTPSMEKSIRKAEERMRNAKNKSPPNFDRPAVIENYSKPSILKERKSCLKNGNPSINKPAKQCSIAESTVPRKYPERPKTAGSSDSKIPAKVPLIYKNTLKLKAAETVRKADKLLKKAEDTLLKTNKTKTELTSKTATSSLNNIKPMSVAKKL